MNKDTGTRGETDLSKVLDPSEDHRPPDSGALSLYHLFQHASVLYSFFK